MQEWEIKLHRRVIGSYLLQVACQNPLPEDARRNHPARAAGGGVNLQRGFVTVQSGGRLQVEPERAPRPPAGEWQTVPRRLRQDLPADSANYTFRLIEPAFQLPLQFERHEAAKLLPARVNSLLLTSVISDEGVMLTQVRLEMLPGDKRLLEVTLPPEGPISGLPSSTRTASGRGAKKHILTPRSSSSRAATSPSLVEFFYSSQIGRPGAAVAGPGAAGARSSICPWRTSPGRST